MLKQQTSTGEFESYWVPHLYGLVLYVNKKQKTKKKKKTLSKLLYFTFLKASMTESNVLEFANQLLEIACMPLVYFKIGPLLPLCEYWNNWVGFFVSLAEKSWRQGLLFNKLQSQLVKTMSVGEKFKEGHAFSRAAQPKRG